jgi:uncharacterized membrane protein (DUF373 family)
VIRLISKFEFLINAVLLVFIAFVVLVTTFQLGWQIVAALFNPPLFHFDENELLDFFGGFLLVLIGVELMDTVKIYLVDKSIHVEVILAVGLVAITRKVVMIDHKQLDGMSLVGIAVIIISLSVSYYLVRLSHHGKASNVP